MPLTHEVEQATGCGDDDVDPGAELRNLRNLADAAEDREVLEGQAASVDAEALEDLRRKLAGRGQDEGAGPVSVGGVPRGPPGAAGGSGEAMEDRKREGGGLAGSGLCAAEDVLPGEDRRDGLDLDRGRGRVAFCGYRANDRLSEPQFIESHAKSYSGSGVDRASGALEAGTFSDASRVLTKTTGIEYWGLPVVFIDHLTARG